MSDTVMAVIVLVAQVVFLYALHHFARIFNQTFGAYTAAVSANTDAVLKAHEANLRIAKKHAEAYEQVLKALDHISQEKSA